MTTKKYAKQTLEDVFSKTRKLSNGCWIYPYVPTINVLWNGTPVYIIKAIFDFADKPYNGKIDRTCGNKRCINPDHLVSLAIEDRFWSNINIGNPYDCWEWKSMEGTGEYAQTHYNGKNVPCHRKAYELFYEKKIPDGMCICHHCDNPPCCNPYHLFLGTVQDNVDDREAKGRNKMPHSKGEDHGHHKLTEDSVRQIRSLYATGKHSYRSLGDIYGVSFGQIRHIIKGRDWSWLK